MALVCPRYDGKGCARLRGTDMRACKACATLLLLKMESLLMEDAVEHCLSLLLPCQLCPKRPTAKDHGLGTVDSTLLGAVDLVLNAVTFGFAVCGLVEHWFLVADELGC